MVIIVFDDVVEVGDHGASLVWPGEVDFCADALWYDAHPEANPHRAGRAAAE